MPDPMEVSLFLSFNFMKKYILLFIVVLVVVIIFLISDNKNDIQIHRESKIPESAVKVTQETDVSQVRSHSNEYDSPVPVVGSINTAGAEDSAFILPDGNTMYFFFTPDVQVPVEEQLSDHVTGIYVSEKINNVWQEPGRIVLQDRGKLSLDGCLFVLADQGWFCTTREGYAGMHWATVQKEGGLWQDWQVNDFPEEYEVGELHISNNSKTLYFHSNRDGGKGGMDVWVSENIDDVWQEPVNLDLVNSEYDEGWPALNPNEDELWISKNYGLWRSKLVDDVWQEPDLMFSPLAGEASVDSAGSVYFTHHYFVDDVMIEADIFVAHKK
jgi:hypothetical protein